MKSIRFLHPAEQKLLDAASYYELQSPGLGYDFLGMIDSAVCDIGEHPTRWPVIRNDICRRIIHRFPYALMYRIESEEIVILATMHLHKHPDYWTNRR